MICSSFFEVSSSPFLTNPIRTPRPWQNKTSVDVVAVVVAVVAAAVVVVAAAADVLCKV